MVNKSAFLLICLMNLITTAVYAVCPLCTVAVGAGVGFSHWLKVDDTITGLWMGALTMSFVIWTVSWLDRKDIHFLGRKLFITAAYYVSLVASLYVLNFLGHPLNTLCGVDKLLLGIIIGSLVFLLGHVGYILIKKQRGHAHFPFQKVVMPIVPLVMMTIIFCFIV